MIKQGSSKIGKIDRELQELVESIAYIIDDLAE